MIVLCEINIYEYAVNIYVKTGFGIEQAQNTCAFTAIGLMFRVFANGPGDWGSIPGRVIPKNQKWYLIVPCLTLSIIR